jgi:hypothetical protein
VSLGEPLKNNATKGNALSLPIPMSALGPKADIRQNIQLTKAS